MRYFLLSLFIFTTPWVAFSNQTHHQLAYENDSLNLRCTNDKGERSSSSYLTCYNEDSWYTSGFLYEFRQRDEAPESPDLSGFSLGQMIFTPQDTKSSGSLENDRPYAGWLFGSYFLESVSDLDYEKRELVVGILGKFSGAEEAQNMVHENTYGNKEKNGQGWEHQIGSELGFVAAYHRSHLLFSTSNLRMDASWFTLGRVGNIFIDGNLGAKSRFGFINPLPPPFEIFNHQSAFFLELTADLKLVAYDATFQGGGFDRVVNNGSNSPHRFDHGDLKPMVATLKAEFVIKTEFGLSFSYMVALRTKEFVNQPVDLQFGRVSLSLSY